VCVVCAFYYVFVDVGVYLCVLFRYIGTYVTLPCRIIIVVVAWVFFSLFQPTDPCCDHMWHLQGKREGFGPFVECVHCMGSVGGVEVFPLI
jgi:hypothetical protein